MTTTDPKTTKTTKGLPAPTPLETARAALEAATARREDAARVADTTRAALDKARAAYRAEQTAEHWRTVEGMTSAAARAAFDLEIATDGAASARADVERLERGALEAELAELQAVNPTPDELVSELREVHERTERARRLFEAAVSAEVARRERMLAVRLALGHAASSCDNAPTDPTVIPMTHANPQWTHVDRVTLELFGALSHADCLRVREGGGYA